MGKMFDFLKGKKAMLFIIAGTEAQAAYFARNAKLPRRSWRYVSDERILTGVSTQNATIIFVEKFFEHPRIIHIEHAVEQAYARDGVKWSA